ncbi:MAG: hypothetical protein ED555_07180 [Allomuricauda sp.]|nr:MAG: hypothetical protein ED555_07180 [Allomuricauda sp.]
MMKKMLNKFMGLSALAIVLVLGACEEGDKVFDQIVEQETRGAILRTTNLISNDLPIGDASGNFSVELEIQDQENGTLVTDVEVYIGFLDNTADIGPGTNVAESLFETVSSSTFSVGEFGLPRFTYMVGLPDMLSFVGRNDSEITGGDQFTVRFELVLSDGRRYSAADNSGTLTGSYFNSPFLYTPTVICPLTASFSGTFDLSLANPGVFSGGVFTEGNVEISEVGTTIREIATVNYPQFGGFNRTFQFDLICGAVVVLPEQDQGLQCTAGVPLIYNPSPNTTTYDPTDDSSLTIIFLEDTEGTCGGPVEVTFTLTKV